MRRTLHSLLSILPLALANPAWAQDPSPFDGCWVLDDEASDEVQRFLERSLRPASAQPRGAMGGPPGGGMGGGMGGGPTSAPGAGSPGSQGNTGTLFALLAGSDRIILDLDGDRLLVSWMDGLPQPLPLGKRGHRVELPTGKHMRIRAWEDPSEGGEIVVRRKVGSVVLMEAFLPPKSPDELIVVVTAKAPSLAMPLAFRRVYRRQAEEGAP